MRKVLSKPPFDWLENWGSEKLCNLFKITWQVRKSWSQAFNQHIILNPKMGTWPKMQQKTEIEHGGKCDKPWEDYFKKAEDKVFGSTSSTWLKRRGKEEMCLFNENLFRMQLTEIFTKFLFLALMLNFAARQKGWERVDDNGIHHWYHAKEWDVPYKPSRKIL